MNNATTSLLLDVVERLEQGIRARDCPAIVALDGTRTLILSDYDYLRDEATAESFERRAATRARMINAVRWVLAVPLIWKSTPGAISAQPVSNRPLGEGEQETITWMSFDHHDGVDYGRVSYTRRPNGEPVFGEPEVFTTELRPGTLMPGNTLLRALMDDDTH